MGREERHTAVLAGCVVRLYRSAHDGRVIVDIDTVDMDDNDAFPDGVPRIVVYVNDERNEVLAGGGWRTFAPGKEVPRG